MIPSPLPIGASSPLAIRGIHIDCRAAMLRFERLLEIFQDLARWGYNTVLLEYEDRFPFQGQYARLRAPDALTRSQVKLLVQHAGAAGLRIIPLVHCLGHLEYVLRHKRYQSVREGDLAQDRVLTTICPSNPASRKLFEDLASQVLETHPDAPLFHMGGDEARLNPHCPRCAKASGRRGVSGILVDHYLQAADWIRRQGPQPIIWCDMPLRYPEALDELAGKVVLMDWDYWSQLRPGAHAPQLWLPREPALPGVKRDDPKTWPALHRQLFLKQIFEDDGKTTRPFPYTDFLVRRGFQVLIAPALRSSGDSFCAPRIMSVDNAIGAARKAAQSGIMGCVITSWALRRAPWPTTELGLIAGGKTMQQPRTTRRTIERTFTQEHFDSTDARNARIPALLGMSIHPLLDSRPQFDPSTGQWWGMPAADRVKQLAAQRPAVLKQIRKLRSNLQRAKPLLDSLQPRTPRQKRNAALWRWVYQMLDFHARLAPLAWTDAGSLKAQERKRLRQECVRLQRLTRQLLARWYTDRTMEAEMQTRFAMPRLLLGLDLKNKGGK